jgi:hypothetical protein
MDGFKNTTKTSYDTTSGRKFANGGMTVSRADMPGGEGPMNKPALVAKYAKGGPAKMALGGTFNEKGKRATLAETEAEDRRMAGRPSEGVSSRPTDASGRRMTNEELGMTSPAKKAKPVGPSSVAVSKVLAGMTKPVKKALGGGVDAKLSHVITQAKANMAAAPRAKSTFVDTMPKGGPQKPSSGNPLMGGMNRGDIVASKHTPTRGPSMAPAHSNRPMIRRAMGGLSVMPKGGKC